jgi:uncharacterized membrane protein
MSAANDFPNGVPNVFQDDAPLYSTVLKPHRSLGRRGFLVLMTAMTLMSASVGLYFFAIGAWPVPGFCGLDVLAVYLAMRLSYRQAKTAEVIRLSRSELTVRRISADGRSAETGLNPYWARLEIDRHPEFGILRISVVWQGRRLVIGSFLARNERETFAREFGAALALARTTPLP